MSAPHVIVLHGLFCSSRIMKRLMNYLSKAGFKVIGLSYPSRTRLLPEIAKMVAKQITLLSDPKEQIHFVAHSMGGIVVRQLFRDYPEIQKRIGRVVMLGAPNQGCEMAEVALRIPLGKKIGGKNLTFFSPKNSVFNDFPLPPETGIIAGTVSANPFSSLIFDEPNDGMVGVEKTKARGMKDWKALPVTHQGLIKEEKVFQQVVSFLKEGRFE